MRKAVDTFEFYSSPVKPHANFKDLTGKKLGRLQIHSRAPDRISGLGNRAARWNCVCECGIKKVVLASVLLDGSTKSCGCLADELSSLRERRHGHSIGGIVSPEYKSWRAMIQRCCDSKNVAFKNYKERGITMCERWLKFDFFLEDMGKRPKGTTLDRINNNGNYEPGNCRWATPKQQGRNTRVNVRYEINGIWKTIPEWSEISGVNSGTIRDRIKSLGWDVDRAIFSPSKTAPETPAHAT